MDNNPSPFSSPQASPPNTPPSTPPMYERPRVVIEDAHPSPGPRDPLFSYLIGAGIVAGLLLIAIIGLWFYQDSKYDTLDTQFQTKVTELGAKTTQLTDVQTQLTASQEELTLFKSDQASITTALTSAMENATDKVNELSQCQNTLLLAQNEIKRLNDLEATNCDTIAAEIRNQCNNNLDDLFQNVTAACRIAVNSMPNATGDEIEDEVEDNIDLTDYTLS